ncbi:MAG TPA: hypothetical protein VMT32_01825 [Bryobacteraceae bacterium]|nr:hypothetical protein [Bryobacteraceae bacterium]
MPCGWKNGNGAGWDSVMRAAGRADVAVELKCRTCACLLDDSGEIRHAVERG